MAGRGETTRATIMDSAESLILDQGFAATSIDGIIGRAGVTKGTFFYHFSSKAALGRALVERWSRLDIGHLEDKLAAAEGAREDPLEQVLALIDAFREDARQLTEPYPGCLFASYCAEAGVFDADTLEVIENTYLHWRERLGGKLAQAAERHPPRVEVPMASLADMMTVVFEGAFIVSKTLKEPAAVAEQLTHFRNYVALLFGDTD